MSTLAWTKSEVPRCAMLRLLIEDRRKRSLEEAKASQTKERAPPLPPVEGGFWKTEVGHNLVARMTAFVPVLVEGTPGLVASTCSHFLTEIINYSFYLQSSHSVLLL